MFSTLKIIPEDGWHDFEKSGYYFNIAGGVPIADTGNLLPFFHAIGDASASYTISTFKLQSLSNEGNTLTEYSLSTSLIIVENNGVRNVMYYLAETDILSGLTSYDAGLYRFYIVDSAGRKWYSEIFEINDDKVTSVVGGGDFNEDFNADFDID